MERIRVFFLLAAVLVSLGPVKAAAIADSGTGQGRQGVAEVKDSLKVFKPSAAYSPAIALTSSIIVPGAGQVYTRHYVKAGLFLLAEAGAGLFGYQRYIWEKELDHNADSVYGLAVRIGRGPVVDSVRYDTAYRYDTTYPGVVFRLEADRDRHDAEETRFAVYQSISWMAGIYYYNILDAVQATGIFKNDSKKRPAVAGWLSAIPCLGLGQFYNGEVSKAGMILMTQFNLGFLAYNYNHIMNECADYEVSFKPSTPEYAAFTSGSFHNDWENRRNTAFRNRNMYLWYSLMFYFYGILDAVVDAHLHDARVRMNLEPDLVPQNKQVGMKLNMPF
jgi:TM2 domain-containing membrane protein YozV